MHVTNFSWFLFPDEMTCRKSRKGPWAKTSVVRKKDRLRMKTWHPKRWIFPMFLGKKTSLVMVASHFFLCYIPLFSWLKPLKANCWWWKKHQSLNPNFRCWFRIFDADLSPSTYRHDMEDSSVVKSPFFMVKVKAPFVMVRTTMFHGLNHVNSHFFMVKSLFFR